MLEMTTINFDQTGNIDSIPGGVSTGYQAQNTIISAIFNGFDNIHVSVDQNTFEATFHAGGSIEENGILYTVKENIVIEIGAGGYEIYFVLDDGGTPGTKTIKEFSLLVPVWSSAKNGWYVGPRRYLNTMLDRTQQGKPLSIKTMNSDGYERFSDTKFVSKHKNLSFDNLELLRYNSPVNSLYNTTLLNLIPNGGISVRNGAIMVQVTGNRIALYNLLNPINYTIQSSGGAVGSKGVAAQSYRTDPANRNPVVDTYCVSDTANNAILVMVNGARSRTIAGPGQSVHGLEFNALGDSLYVVDKIGSKIFKIEFSTGFVQKQYSVSSVLYDDIALYSGFRFVPAIGGQLAFLSRVTNPNMEYTALYKTAVDIVILYKNGTSEKLHTLLYTSDAKRGVSFGDTGSSSTEGDYRGDLQTLFSVDTLGNFLFI